MKQPDTDVPALGNDRADTNGMLFLAYRVTSRLYFHLPILFVHFMQVDLGLARIIFLLTIYGVVTTLTAGASGRLLQYLSEKNVVAVGEVLKIVGLCLILWGTRLGDVSMTVLVIAQLIGGAGFSIALATDSSLLKTISTESKDPHFFTTIQTRSQNKMFMATLAGGTLGSIFFSYHPFWPFFGSIFSSLIAVVLIMMVTTSAKSGAITAQAPALELTYDQRFWMNFYSLSRAFTIAPFVGFLPFYFVMVDVDPLLFGAVLSLFTLSAFAASNFSNRISERWGYQTLLAAMLVCMVSSMAILGSSTWLAMVGIDYFLSGLVAIALLGFGSGAVRAITMANLDLARIGPPQRVALFTRMERNFGIANGLLLVIGGYLLTIGSFDQLAWMLAGMYMVSILALMVFKGEK